MRKFAKKSCYGLGGPKGGVWWPAEWPNGHGDPRGATGGDGDVRSLVSHSKPSDWSEDREQKCLGEVVCQMGRRNETASVGTSWCGSNEVRTKEPWGLFAQLDATVPPLQSQPSQ